MSIIEKVKGNVGTPTMIKEIEKRLIELEGYLKGIGDNELEKEQQILTEAIGTIEVLVDKLFSLQKVLNEAKWINNDLIFDGII